MVRWMPLGRPWGSRGSGLAATAPTGTAALSGGGVAIAMGFAFAGSLAATAGAASLLAGSGFAGTPGSGSGGSVDDAATLSGSFFAGPAATPGSRSGGGADADCSAAGDASRSTPGNVKGASGFFLSAAEPEGGSTPGSGRPGSANVFPGASSCV